MLHCKFTKDVSNSSTDLEVGAKISDEAFLGSKLTNPFYYQKHALNELRLYRNGYAIAATPLSTDDEKRVHLTTMDAFDFGYQGHGTPFTNYTNQFGHVFDLTSTQQASNDFLFPELTDVAVSLELKLPAALPAKTEVFPLAKNFRLSLLIPIKKCPKTSFRILRLKIG